MCALNGTLVLFEETCLGHPLLSSSSFKFLNIEVNISLGPECYGTVYLSGSHRSVPIM